MHQQPAEQSPDGFYRFSAHDVFSDFVEWSTLSIRQAIDLRAADAIKKRIGELNEKYNAGERRTMTELFVHLTEAMQGYAEIGEYSDVLGRVFQDLELQNKKTEQYFTPWSLSLMSAKAAFDEEKARRSIDEHGYISLMEPSAGAGSMILAFAETMRDAGFNPGRELLVHATDIDFRCACMNFIQLSLYGIPAVVMHGNTLTLEIYGMWFTPIYVLDLWLYRDKILSRREAKSG